jgi:drug/metabolite transporter (DMT)-like permease
MNQRSTGIQAAFSSAVFLGLAPVFGRQAILMGLSPLAVAALRTILAALLLFVVMAIFRRRYLYIYPAGLLGCMLAGGINGLGSLLFYGSLARIDASVGQLLNSTYPLFVAFWFALDYQPPSRITIFRLFLTLPAIYLLTQAGQGKLDIIGVVMMLGAAAMYALHLPINQRVLYDMPSPTVTLYTLLSMSAVVVPIFLLFGTPETIQGAKIEAWWPLFGLTIATFLSRLTLFLGVKHLGGMQTAIIGLGELLVTFLVAFLWLGERLSPEQWLGALLLAVSILLIGLDKTPPPQRRSGGWLRWLTTSTHTIEGDISTVTSKLPEKESKSFRTISEY